VTGALLVQELEDARRHVRRERRQSSNQAEDLVLRGSMVSTGGVVLLFLAHGV
jgi:hypothetical protein